MTKLRLCLENNFFPLKSTLALFLIMKIVNKMRVELKTKGKIEIISDDFRSVIIEKDAIVIPCRGNQEVRRSLKPEWQLCTIRNALKKMSLRLPANTGGGSKSE